MSSWHAIRFTIPAAWVPTLEELADQSEEWPWLLSSSKTGAKEGEISGYFPDPETACEQQTKLRNAMKEAGLTPLPQPVQPVEEQETDWEALYRAHFEPWSWGGIHWVPIWQKESYPIPPDESIIWLDPGMAFGTGNHETTRLCLKAMTRWISAQKQYGKNPTEYSLIDAGCGSGILAFSAAALGFSPVWGFDIDPVSVEVANKNIALQEIPVGNLQFHQGDLTTGWQGKRAKVVVANILGHILVAHRNDLVLAVEPGGCLILSGILASEAEEVADSFRPFFRHCAIEKMGEWASVVLERPSR
ncbi:MAG: 50S ribosomal protein L11 methyltransferase [Opitutales bacterium]|nr:50S ribosomal protein L11 methyltransferase [Opitutales bacterium]MCH8540646.1 50S ribosomal protein L11 methyltransferase [Opitutales bacterium]